MPSNLPERKPAERSAGDKLWLFSKVILFVLLHYVTILVSVMTSITLGSMAFMGTQSKAIGLVSGIGVYLACMGGKKWLIDGMAPQLFSEADRGNMDKVIDEGKK